MSVRQYPFKVSVYNPELVKIGGTRHDLRELEIIGIVRLESKEWAHQPQTVCFWIGFGIFHHVPILHPVRDDTKTTGIRGERYSQQWQDIGVRQVLPTYDFPAKPLLAD